MNKLFILMFALIMCSVLISAETKNIEYQIKITYTPHCEEQFCNSTNSTNETCYNECYGMLKLEGVDENNIFVEIDLGDEFWRDGASSSRFGYKSADIGNLSDISGIKDELANLTQIYDNLGRCKDALRNYDVNLSNCKFMTGYGGNYTLQDCDIDKTNLQNTVNNKNNEIKELKDFGNEKYMWGIGGVILAYIFLTLILPKLQGKAIPKDPVKEQFGSNVGY